MSNVIDERIVEMQFDNKQFERGIEQSMETLKKLEKSLQFEDADEGFKNITRAAENVDLSSLTKSIEEIAFNTSWLGDQWKNILNGITGAAKNAAHQITGFFEEMSVQQIKPGFGSYEKLVSSEQTILNAVRSKGYGIDEVEAVLSELQWYADETSYSFDDMTSTLGKFTTAGVDLRDAIPMIMGVSNWAALSGVNAQKASIAFYNLAQAISSGSLKLADWRSLELAGMVSEDFNNNLIKAGVSMGTLVEKSGKFYTTGKKGIEVTSTNVRDTLSKGWVNTDVLKSVLSEYGAFTEEVYDVYQQYKSKVLDSAEEEAKTTTDVIAELSAGIDNVGIRGLKAAQEAKTFTDAIEATKEAVRSGWTNSFKIIFGNYEEAKVVFTDLTDMLWNLFAAGAEARNILLTKWRIGGGRTDLFVALSNLYTVIQHIFDVSSNILNKIFPITSNGLIDITHKFRLFTDSIVESLGLVNEYRSDFEKNVDGITEAVDNAVSFITGKEGTVQSAFKSMFTPPDQAKADDIKETMPDWMIRWIDKLEDAEFDTTHVKRKWRKQNRDLWYEFKAAMIGGDAEKWKREADAYAAMPDWMKDWADKVGADRDLPKIRADAGHPWSPQNIALFEAYCDAMAEVAEISEEVSTSVEESSDETAKVETRGSKLSAIAAAVTLTASMFANAIATIASGIGSIVKSIGSFGLDVIMTVASGIAKIVISIQDFVVKLGLLETVVGVVVTVVTGAVDLTRKAFNKLWSILQNGIAFVSSLTIFDALGKVLIGFVNNLPNIVKAIGGYLGVTMNYIRTLPVVQKVIGKFTAFIDKVKNKIRSVSDTLTNLLAPNSGNFAKGIDGLLKKIQTKLRKGLDKISELIIEFVSGPWKEFKKTFKESSAYIAVKTLAEKVDESFRGFLTDPLKHLSEIAGKIKEKFTDLVNLFKEFGVGLSSNIRDILKSPKDALRELGTKIFASLASVFKDPTSTLRGLKDKIIGCWIKALEFVKSAFPIVYNRLTDWIKQFGFDIPFLSSFNNIEDVLVSLKGKLSSIVNKLKDMVLSLDIGSGISNTIKKFFSFFSFGNILNFVKLVSKIRLMKVLADIGSLLSNSGKGLRSGLKSFLKSMGDVAKAKAGVKIDTLGDTLLKIAGTIVILVAVLWAIQMLSKDEDSFRLSLEVLALLAVGLVSFVKVLSSIKGMTKRLTSIRDLGVGILALAVAIGLIMFEITQAAKMAEDPEKLIKGGTVLAGIMASLVLFLSAADFQKLGNKNAWKSILAVAAAMWIIVQTLKPLADFKWEQLGKMGSALVGIGVVLSAVILALGKANQMAGGKLSWGAILAFAFSISIILAALTPLIFLKWGQLGKMGAALAGITAAISAMSISLGKASKKMKLGPALALILGIAALMSIFTFCLLQVKDVDWKLVSVFSAGLSVMLLAMAGSIKILENVDFLSGVKAAVLMAAFIVAIGVSLSLVTDLLSTAIMNALSKVSFGLLIAGENIEKFVKSMSGVTEEDSSRIASIFGDLIGIIADIPVGASTKAFDLQTAMGYLGTAVSVMMTGLETYEHDKIVNARIDLIAFKNFIGTLQDSGYASKSSDFQTAMGNLGTGVSTMMTGLETYDHEKISSALQDLAAFRDFNSTIQGFKADDINEFLKILLALGGASLLFDGNDFEISDDGFNISEEQISSAFSKLDAIIQAVPAWFKDDGHTFEDLNLPDSTSTGAFAVDLAALASAVAGFGTAANGITDETVQQVTDMFNVIGELKTQLNSGVLAGLNLSVGDFLTLDLELGKTETQDLDDFGTKLASLGTSLRNFIENVTRPIKMEDDSLLPINMSKVRAAVESVKLLSAMQKDFDPENSFWTWISGQNRKNLGEFGSELASLGTNLRSFIENVVKPIKDQDEELIPIDENAINTAIDAIRVLSEIESGLALTGGLEQFLSGEKDLTNLANGMNDLGVGFANFAGSVSGAEFDVDKVLSAATAVRTLAEAVFYIGNFDASVYGFSALINDLTDTYKTAPFSKKEEKVLDRKGLASTMVDFSKELKDFDHDAVSSAVESLESFAEVSIIDFPSVLHAVIEIIENIRNTVITSVGMLLDETRVRVDEGVGDISFSAVKTIRSWYTSFYSAGEYLSEGLANGLEDSVAFVTQAAEYVANQAILTTKATFDQASPSKVYAEIGRFNDLGLAKGMIDNAYSVSESSEYVAKEAINPIKYALGHMSSILAEDMDSTPTITPVLDLSEVASGASKIGSIFGDKTLSVAGISTSGISANAIRSYGATNQNGIKATTSPDVVMAIQRLESRIDSLGESMSKMRVVLDSGATVGQLESQIDRRLGIRMMNRERGL